MALIFISYSAHHRDLTKQLAAALEEQYGPGAVWWDQALESRAAFEPQIKAALEQARVVVVIWSIAATTSDFVYSEASDAARGHKLVNVRPADVPFHEIPKPFDVYHIDDLADTDRILATIAKVMRGVPVPTRVPLAEVYFRHHGRRILDEKRHRLPADPLAIGPSDLLQAKYAVVGYDDAAGMCERMVEWCLAARPTVGRLVHGPGGTGKTRLFAEVAARLRRDHGWEAGLLDRPPEEPDVARQRSQALEQLIAHGDSRGLLVVIDYAEARQKEVVALAERLWQRSAEEIRPIRLVLLSRSAGDWWDRLMDDREGVRAVFREAAGGVAVCAMPIVASGQQRLRHFAASVRAFAPFMRAQGYTPATPDPSAAVLARIEESERHVSPLAIQMEAMLWLASAIREDDAGGVDTLLARVLGLERSHWQKLLGALGDEETRDLERAVAQVTAVQGVDGGLPAEHLLMADRFYGDRSARASVEPIARRLARLYGRRRGAIGGLEPDLLGEHHVAMTADPELIDGCVAWIERQQEAVRMTRRQDLLTVLQRATHAHHGQAITTRAGELLDHIIRHHGETMGSAIVAVMMETSGALFGCLAAQVDTLTPSALEEISDALPLHYVPWMAFSLRVAERHAELARQPPTLADESALHSPERFLSINRSAGAMATLAMRLFDLGRSEDALTASTSAVELFRSLVGDGSEVFLPNVAASLNTHGNILAACHRREDAVAAAMEAVEVRRALARRRPFPFADLASSLNNLGSHLSDVDRHDEALDVFQEAVVICRALAKDRAEASLRNLASSLNNYGNCLAALSQTEGALAATSEAVDIYRSLAETRPYVFVPLLAKSLNNLGARLSDLGRDQEALDAAEQAVEIFSPIVAEWPEGNRATLAGLLTSLASRLSLVGRREEALIASIKAVDIYRALAKERPQDVLPDLATSLTAFCNVLSDLGRREEALAPAVEAVNIRTVLARDRPDEFRPDLARSLGTLSQTLAAVNRFGEAAEMARHGLIVICPFLEKRAQVFGELSRALGSSHVTACNSAGREPDWELLHYAMTLAGGAAK